MLQEYSEKELVEKSKKYSTPLPGFTPLVMTEAKGCIVKDINGREYIDGISICAGPATVGSAHPKVVNAVIEQVKKLSGASPWCVMMLFISMAMCMGFLHFSGALKHAQ